MTVTVTVTVTLFDHRLGGSQAVQLSRERDISPNFAAAHGHLGSALAFGAIAAEVGIVLQGGPGHWIKVLAHSHEAAEAENGIRNLR